MSEKKAVNPKMLPGNFEALKKHVEETRHPDWTDSKGYGFLHACALFDAKESCDFLLQFLDPNMQDSDGLTPLAYAATEDATEVISSLISHNAKVDLPCNDMDIYLRPAHIYTSGGKTPLMWACERGSFDAVCLLLQANADPQRADLSGAIAIDYAIFGGSKECFDLLNKDHHRKWPDRNERDEKTMNHFKITRDRIQNSAKKPSKAKLSKIVDKYKPKHSRVYELDEDWMFSSELREALASLELQDEIRVGSKVRTPAGEIATCERFIHKTNRWRVKQEDEIYKYEESQLALVDKMEVLANFCVEPSPGIWTFPCLTSEFCTCLLEEIEHIEVEAQRLYIELHRPNSMNRYGMVLNEVGFQKLLDALMNKLVNPLSNVLLPTACRCAFSFGSDYSFIIRYRQGEDLKLETHVDSSDITLNVCLGKKFTGGKLYFHGVKGNEQSSKNYPNDSSNCKFKMDHLVGSAVLHRGNVVHGADRLLSGERCNLIMWCRV